MITTPEIQSDTTQWFNQRGPDGGPIYTETNFEHLIAEPLNMVPSLLAMIRAIYFLFKIRKEISSYRFLFWGIVLIMLASVGSTLYHGFRSSVVFLIMDIAPIVIFMIALSIYFWLKVLKKWWYVLFILIPFFGIRPLMFYTMPEHLAINIGYALSGLLIVVPAVWYLKKSDWKYGRVILYAVIFFLVALFFRQADAFEPPLLPVGTHFLWHVLSAFGTYFILLYLYRRRKLELNPPEADKGSFHAP
ncbi:MAG: ceramidase [Bacteroidales bacterium]|nr:ceramidase [Bacteroidales bacterium]